VALEDDALEKVALEKIASSDFATVNGDRRQEIAHAISFSSGESESLALASASRFCGAEQFTQTCLALKSGQLRMGT
jgi:hypothetical protein